MYCPKCSQEQISDEVRFCPRCGFQLDALKLMLAENQNGLAMSEAERETQLVSTRKRDVSHWSIRYVGGSNINCFIDD